MTVAANFKANHTRGSTSRYFDILDLELGKLGIRDDFNVLVFPNQACLMQNNYSFFDVGAQNAYHTESGAFTGEIGVEVLRDFGINTIMVGHSERRLLGETRFVVLDKFNFFAKHGFHVVLCVGDDVFTGLCDLKEFLKVQLDGIDTAYGKLTVAYEPVWSVGSGVTPGLDVISAAVGFIRDLGVSNVLYGGSVNVANAKDISAVSDGLLVGGSSLHCDSFLDIIRSVLNS